MFQLVDQSVLPSEFVQIKSDSPLCAYFIYGKAHRKSWRTYSNNLAIKQDTDNAPGKGASMDQLIPGQPGPIPQIGGHLTTARIWASNVSVDQFRNLVYNHLMKSTTQEDTLNTKTAYECFTNDHGIKVCQYHANYGRYGNETFWEAVADVDQIITYCGVSVHHQYGIT